MRAAHLLLAGWLAASALAAPSRAQSSFQSPSLPTVGAPVAGGTVDNTARTAASTALTQAQQAAAAATAAMTAAAAKPSIGTAAGTARDAAAAITAETAASTAASAAQSTASTASSAASAASANVNAQLDDAANVSGLGACVMMRGVISTKELGQCGGLVIGQNVPLATRISNQIVLQTAINYASANEKPIECVPGSYELYGAAGSPLTIPYTGQNDWHGSRSCQLVQFNCSVEGLVIGDKTALNQSYTNTNVDGFETSHPGWAQTFSASGAVFSGTTMTLNSGNVTGNPTAGQTVTGSGLPANDIILSGPTISGSTLVYTMSGSYSGTSSVSGSFPNGQQCTIGQAHSSSLVLGPSYDNIVSNFGVSEAYPAPASAGGGLYSSAPGMIGINIPYANAGAAFFNNHLEKFEVRNAQKSLFVRAAMGTGNTYLNGYFTDGFNGGGDAMSGRGVLTGDALQFGSLAYDGITNLAPNDGGFHGGSDDRVKDFNIEAVCGSPNVLHVVAMGNTHFDTLHMEGLSLCGNYGGIIRQEGGEVDYTATGIAEFSTVTTQGPQYYAGGYQVGNQLHLPSIYSGSIVAGQSVQGFGYPAGETIVSGSAGLYTVSQSASVGSSSNLVTTSGSIGVPLLFNGTATATIQPLTVIGGSPIYSSPPFGVFVPYSTAVSASIPWYNGIKVQSVATNASGVPTSVTFTSNPNIGTAGSPVTQAVMFYASGASIISLAGSAAGGFGEVCHYGVLTLTAQFQTSSIMPNTPLIQNTSGTAADTPIACELDTVKMNDLYNQVALNLIVDAVNYDILPTGSEIKRYDFDPVQPQDWGFQPLLTFYNDGNVFDYFAHHHHAKINIPAAISANSIFNAHSTYKGTFAYPSTWYSQLADISDTLEIARTSGTYANQVQINDVEDNAVTGTISSGTLTISTSSTAPLPVGTVLSVSGTNVGTVSAVTSPTVYTLTGATNESAGTVMTATIPLATNNSSAAYYLLQRRTAASGGASWMLVSP